MPQTLVFAGIAGKGELMELLLSAADFFYYLELQKLDFSGQDRPNKKGLAQIFNFTQFNELKLGYMFK